MARFEALTDWLQWQEQCHSSAIDLGLERVAAVYRRLGVAYKPITITVAGTNGKGSCVAYLEAVYRAQGYKVGAYTSPHILRYNERIRIDGQAVDDGDIVEAFSAIDQARGDTTLSFFEFGTLAALDIFSRQRVDVQLLEVGLGGRLDAVNIVDPDVALVTTIALDHVDWLGDSTELIAREKAGIFRTDVPAIIGDDSAADTLRQAALTIKARPMQLASDYRYRKRELAWDWLGPDRVYLELPPPAFKGEHQYRNVSATIMAVESLQDRLPVAEQAIRQGVSGAKLLGRFQLLTAELPVLLDVGHNPQAVRTLLEYLQSDYPAVKIRAVFAMMKDKDIAGVVELMRDRVEAWYLAPLQNPRAASLEQLQTCFQTLNVTGAQSDFANVAEAYQAACRDSDAAGMILVFGSFFLVSEFLSYFASR